LVESSFGRRGAPTLRLSSAAEAAQRWTALDTLFQIVLESVEVDSSSSGLQHLAVVHTVVFGALSDAEVRIARLIRPVLLATDRLQEPVRQKAGIFVDSLQPMHLASVANVLQARFTEVGLEGKLELCAFLLQLRGRLPEWQGTSSL
jgi:hypothetical protein